ncbi:MAG: translation initiation factor IF-2 [Desulfovibrio sp.]|nr:translation initiation factor IF-2 [Desulfovibrio sp.]
MTLMDWAIIGALLLGIIIWCFRRMRRGVRTLDDDRETWMAKIQSGKKLLEEDRKNISADERLMVVRAAMEDLLRLDDNPEGCAVRSDGRKLELTTPKGAWSVELIMNERKLRSAPKILHGRSRWLLSGFGHFEHHEDPAGLMRSLNEHLRSREWDAGEPAHLARRFSGRVHPEKSSPRHARVR